MRRDKGLRAAARAGGQKWEGGCDIGADFDLLNTPDGQILEAPAMRAGGRVVVQIEKKRDKDASIFCVMVKS